MSMSDAEYNEYRFQNDINSFLGELSEWGTMKDWEDCVFYLIKLFSESTEYERRVELLDSLVDLLNVVQLGTPVDVRNTVDQFNAEIRGEIAEKLFKKR